MMKDKQLDFMYITYPSAQIVTLGGGDSSVLSMYSSPVYKNKYT